MKKIILSLGVLGICLNIGLADDKTDNNLKKIEGFRHELGYKSHLKKNKALGVTVRDNNLQVRICTTPNWKPSLANGSGILSDCKNVKYLKFLVTKHYESEGQPYDGVITEDDNDTYGSNIDVRVGRHHSEKPILYIVKDYPELEKKKNGYLIIYQ